MLCGGGCGYWILSSSKTLSHNWLDLASFKCDWYLRLIVTDKNIFNAVTPKSCCINKSAYAHNLTVPNIIVLWSLMVCGFLSEIIFEKTWPGQGGQWPARQSGAWLAPWLPWLVIPHSSRPLLPGRVRTGSVSLSQPPQFIAPPMSSPRYCQSTISGKNGKKTGTKNPGKTFQIRLDDRDGCGEIVPDSPHRIRTWQVHGWDET